jgi:TetR/AcrR family transcriptional regulator, transcriptional repressor for nem operon
MPRTRTLSDEVVLERAIAVFWRQGYAGASLRDLTQATGLSAAALYHRFADKDGLFVAALTRYADEGLNARLARLAAFDDPLKAVRALFDELVALSLADPERRGCLLVNTALDGAPMSQAARAVVRERLDGIEAFFAAQLRRAAANGRLPGQVEIANAASALLGAVLGLRVLARLDPDPRRMRALVEHAMAGLLRGGGKAKPPASLKPA